MKKSLNLSLWSVVVLLVLAGGILLFALYSTGRVGEANEASVQIEANWLPSTRLLGLLEADVLAYRVAEMQHVLSLEEEEMRRYETEMDSALASIAGRRGDYEPLIASEEERHLYETFLASWGRYLEESRRALDLSRQNQNREATALLRRESLSLFNQANDNLEALFLLNVETASVLSRQGDRALGGFRLALVVFLVLGGALFLLICVDLIGKNVRRRGVP